MIWKAISLLSFFFIFIFLDPLIPLYIISGFLLIVFGSIHIYKENEIDKKDKQNRNNAEVITGDLSAVLTKVYNKLEKRHD